ncbi:MAG TPA: hypothetical protein VGG75_32645 [Trebonia sp.]
MMREDGKTDLPEPPGWLDEEDVDPAAFEWVKDADFDALDPLGSDVPHDWEDGGDDAWRPYPGRGDPEWGEPPAGSAEELASRVLGAGDPSGIPDLELGDLMAEWQAIEAMAAGRKHAATAELMRRREARKWDKREGWREGRRHKLGAPAPGRDPATGAVHVAGAGASGVRPVLATREAEEETALALTVTTYAARAHVELTFDLECRLPLTCAELAAGRATELKAKLVAGYAQDLSEEDAGKLDARIAPHLEGLTTGQLRDRLARLLVSIDAEAAELRRERSERSARVSLYGNPEGTATFVIDRVPAALGASAKARVSTLARMYKNAGSEEPVARLEAKIALGFLLGVPPDIDLVDERIVGNGRQYRPVNSDGTDGRGSGPGDGTDGSGPDGSGLGPEGDGHGPDAGPSGGGPEDGGPEDGGLGGGQAGRAGPGREDLGPTEPGRGDPWPADEDAPSGGPEPPDPEPPDPEPAKPEPAKPEPAKPGPGRPGAGDQDAGSPGQGSPFLVGLEAKPDDEWAVFDPFYGSTDVPDAVPWQAVPAGLSLAAPGGIPLPGRPPAGFGRLKLTAPWRSLLGVGSGAGDLTWIGPVTPGTAREIALAAAADPSAAWNVIVTDDDGQAIVGQNLRPGNGTAEPGMTGDVLLTITAAEALARARSDDLGAWCAGALASAGRTVGTTSRHAATGPAPGAGSIPGVTGTGTEAEAGTAVGAAAELARILARAVTAAVEAAAGAEEFGRLNAEAGGCAHTLATDSYEFRGRLRQFVAFRAGTCRNPICRQPASRCDIDHVVPYEKGGRTCSCNGGPECRRHHQTKQLPGWRVTMTPDGYFTWHAPSGVYQKEPHRYTV